jgi:hypothetical protein
MTHAPQPLPRWQCAAVIAVLIALGWLVWNMAATLCRAGRGLYIVILVGVICLAGCRSIPVETQKDVHWNPVLQSGWSILW